MVSLMERKREKGKTTLVVHDDVRGVLLRAIMIQRVLDSRDKDPITVRNIRKRGQVSVLYR